MKLVQKIKMPSNIFLYILSTLFFLASCKPKVPEEIGQAYDKLPEKIDFNFHVKPILSEHCFACHGPDEKARKADLRLDTEAAAFAALKDKKGYAFLAGKPFKSLAIQRILSTDSKKIMPPLEAKNALNDQQKAMLIKWLDQGGEWKAHWSFIQPQKAKLPKVQEQDLLQNEIDYFILSRLEREGLSFSEKASKENLLRRLSLDLIGLPPSLEILDNFLADNNPDAFENMVDQLLASPKFGERWAWDWLDAARYADTNGFQGDPERKMWPWRDWVIKALNENMPYDQFTIEQLAGDLLAEASQDQILATAFNRNHMYNGEGGRIAEETRVENVFDRVETMGSIWLGLTLNCSRCHDHKFDPISQKEYYQFFDYFNQSSEAGKNGGGQIPPVLDLSPAMDQAKIEEAKAFVKELAEKVDDYENKLFPRSSGPAANSEVAKQLSGDNVFALGFPPEERGSYHLGLIQEAFEGTDPYYIDIIDELKVGLGQLNKQIYSNLQVMVMDEIENPRPTFMLDVGLYDKAFGEAIKANVPEVLPALGNDRSHNRLELAQWLTNKNHPLTARVTVNRIWQSLFGQGLVKTPEDFGVQGDKPSHPVLLDWLAVDFVESGWDQKALIKKIVLSATYQQQSKSNDRLLEIDPENKLLARAPRYRLPSWMLRDQALFISGLLNDSIGGPPVKPYQPEGIWEEATFGQKKYIADKGANLYRRTLYVFWRRIVGPTMLFDNANRQVCSVKPILTNSPQHALVTLNDVTYVEAARLMAERVLREKTEPESQIIYAFRLATSRYPTDEEKEILLKKLNSFKEDFSKKPEEAKALLEIGASPLNRELNLIDQAAFSTLCSLILNLDETLNKQ